MSISMATKGVLYVPGDIIIPGVSDCIKTVVSDTENILVSAQLECAPVSDTACADTASSTGCSTFTATVDESGWTNS